MQSVEVPEDSLQHYQQAARQRALQGMQAFLEAAGLTAAEVGKLQEMPWKEYYALATKAQQKLAAEFTGASGGLRRGYNPYVDGQVLPQHPYSPAAAP